MEITPASLEGMFTGFSTVFNMAREAATPQWPRMAMRIPSTKKQETHGWLGRLPRMKEWLSERTRNRLETNAYELPNKKYEDSFLVARDDIEDDSYGLLTPAVQDLAYAAAYWPDDMLQEAIQAGDATPCFDGQNFFDTDHPVNQYKSELGTQANLLTSTALTQDNLFVATAAMRRWKDESGKSMKLKPTLMLVPPELEKKAREILNGTTIAQIFGVNTAAAAPTNVAAGMIDLLVWEELTSATTWYLLSTNRPLKPFIYQERRVPKLVQKTAPDSENVYSRDEFEYGIDGRGAVGYTLPGLAFQMNA